MIEDPPSCVICLEPIEEQTTCILFYPEACHCKTWTHNSCGNQWLQQHTKCLICKKDLQANDFMTLCYNSSESKPEQQLVQSRLQTICSYNNKKVYAIILIMLLFLVITAAISIFIFFIFKHEITNDFISISPIFTSVSYSNTKP